MTPDQPRCGARRKNGKGVCESFAMANGRCRVHGGATPSGLASPQTISGRYSKYLPTRLLARYQEAVADPELLALKDDIALLDTRLGEVIANLDTGRSQATWEILGHQWGKFAAEWKTMDWTAQEKAVDSVSKLIADGLSEGYVWSEIRGLLKERSELVANERKRLVELQQYVTSERALLFVQAVMASVKQHVTEPTTLRAIAADLARLSDVPDGGRIAVAG